MSISRTQIYRFRAQSSEFLSYRTGISLHSHTMHSKEYLGRLPNYIAKFPIGSYILEREIGRVHPCMKAEFSILRRSIGRLRCPHERRTNWSVAKLSNNWDAARWCL